MIEVEGLGVVRIQIWDTAGTTRYNTITPNYYRNVDGIFLVFDLTSKKSYEMVSYWIKEVNEKTDIAKIDMLIVGNKKDLEDERQIAEDEAIRLS